MIHRVRYLKTAWQNLRSHRAYAAINTVGLAVGIAACLLVFLLIQYETSRLSGEFTLLIGVAFLIAAPLAYYFMHQWLQTFAYRINIGVGLFGLTLLIGEILAWLTVGYQAIKAAVANPVKSLRME